jgi:hypothetical protein
MKLSILSSKGGEPKPTTQQLMEANLFAKAFARRKGHINAESTHVGGELPKYVDASGKPLSKDFSPIPMSMVSPKVPAYVKELEWDEANNMPYYVDNQSGDMKYVQRDLFFTDRYNPRRTYARNSIVDYAKK